MGNSGDSNARSEGEPGPRWLRHTEHRRRIPRSRRPDTGLQLHRASRCAETRLSRRLCRMEIRTIRSGDTYFFGTSLAAEVARERPMEHPQGWQEQDQILEGSLPLSGIREHADCDCVGWLDIPGPVGDLCVFLLV